MKIAKTIVRVSSVANGIALWGAVLAVGMMVFAAFWQVVARYIFASPPVWTEELARYAMVWAGMLGASCAFHAGSDPVLFPNALSMKGRKGMMAAVVRGLAVAIFAAPVLWFCLVGPTGTWVRGFIARAISRNADTLGISMVWIAVAIPTAFVLICLHAVAAIALRTLSESPAKDPAAPADVTP